MRRLIATILTLCILHVSTVGTLTCPAGWNSLGLKCYKMYHQTLSYWDAKKYCNDQNADVIMPKTAEENNTMKTLIEQIKTTKPYYGIWIGLTDHASENNWRWNDGTKLNSANAHWWTENNEPNGFRYENCGTGYIKAEKVRWLDSKCRSLDWAVCQLKAGRYKEPCSTAVTSCYSPLICASGLCECETHYYYNADNDTCNTFGRYKEHCSIAVTSCYSPLICASGLCECEPNHFYKADYNTCNTFGRYTEPCSTEVNSCYSPLICASDLCECETNHYYNDDDNTCTIISTYNEACSTLVGNSTCYNNMVCVSDICDCEIPAMQYHDSYDKSCKAMSTYNENCSTQVGDASCYNDMVCNSGICDCEIPATQYHDPYDKSCKAMSTYNDNCTTLVGDSTCYNNMVCVSDICDCEIPAMQYHDPYAKSCEAIRTYKENCSTFVGDSTCFNNMVCVSGTCDCEIPAMQYYVFYDKSCKTRAKYKESCQALEDGSNCYGNMICVSGVCGCNTTQYYNPNVHSCNEMSTYNDNCTTLVGDSTCYNNMVCVSDICDCEIPAMQYHDPYAKSCEAIRTYKENCSTSVGDSTCFNNMVCVSGTCDCEIPAMQYYVFYDKSCKTRAKYKESCQALEDGSNCYGNMICVSGVCGCNTTQYYNPNVHSCNETGRYLDPCSTAVRNISCYPPLLCSSSVCHCELPAMMHYVADDNTCNDASFNAEEFVNDTKGFGNIVGATMDSIHHMHIEIEEKEHIIEEMVTVLAVLPTENEAEMENVLEASNQISKEADALTDNVQDALLNVMDKISDQISHTDVNKSEPGKVENMVKSLFDSSSNLLDLNHVPERHTVKEKVIVEDKSETETENVKHVEETEPEQEVPYESPEEQQETQVKETEAEIKAREKKMLFSDKNPRSWDKSSAYINSPMISLILKDLNQKTLDVTKLPKPIIIDIPIGRNEKFSEFILNSQEDNFIRLKVKQPANMFYMLKLMTDGPQYNMSVKIAIEFHKQVSLSDAENGTLISYTQIAFLKEPEKKSLYWSIGLIVNDRRDGNISQNISVKISSTGINCRYWNNTIGKWVPDGCRVSPVSSSETLECEGDHLTDFAGGVFVLPNIVDPFQDALLFLTFFDNPVVVTVVILVWLIYFLGLYRARQADRKDSNFDGIVTPFPSDPSDPFKYLMCIVTGWRYDARTTANVSCYIKGNNGQSARHCLSRTSSPQVLFTSGGEDWFLITSSYNIGDMVNVIVWHDNSGSSPSWFLSRIIIQDLQTKKGI
ncbi:uncharacterized protein LOC134687076 isoform X2 [Mytilus trossulus]|uniref:uncharacterized protein LOC134687076 isoform X2 n=1 Tax=Mytilus trossulus TaxID=6551 RepID=UPI003004C5E1